MPKMKEEKKEFRVCKTSIIFNKLYSLTKQLYSLTNFENLLMVNLQHIPDTHILPKNKFKKNKLSFEPNKHHEG